MEKCLTREEVIALVEETIAKGKKKRKKSEYNIFIGKCTSEGEDLKACAKKWQEQK